ncbi:protein artichoke-like [Sitodiplosis mosellana]|uniref:protein artichoke-like n=1 Tax=Sitodiplosis mosellana TaxID=263140 RepID=UPI0024441E15|nr:protein artichoke-like [Sitodiplosis mosellana]
MKSVIVFILLISLVKAQSVDNNLPYECYSRTNNTVYLRLETLDLSNTKLESKDSLVLAIDQKLKELYLGGSLLKELNWDFIAKLDGLKIFDMSNTRIKEIDDDCFVNSSNMKELYLSGIPLRQISCNVFASLSNLQTLDLSNTEIEDIFDHCFVNNPNMKEVNLEGTPLKKFNFNTFSSEAELVEVHLPSESIQELDISYQITTKITLFSIIFCAGKCDRQRIYFSFLAKSLDETSKATNGLHVAGNTSKMSKKDILGQDDYVSKEGCLKQNQYDKSSVKLITYKCGKPITLKKFYLDVLDDFKNSDMLDISNLGIEAVVASSLQFKSQIKKLRASHNNLTQIPYLHLDHMPQLTEIDLSNNQFQVVNFTQFSKPNIISLVNLSSNNISDISDGAFSHLQELKTSDLSNNNIQTINERTFATNHKLIDLNLGNNLLKSLAPAFISSLKMLEKLDLSNTKIEQINDDCFENNTNLKVLNLEGTSLTKFNFNTFSSKARLLKVYLPSNGIKELDISCAKPSCDLNKFYENDLFENIRILNASGNQKQNIALLGKIAPNVETLDLSRTSIVTLNVGMLRPFRYIRHLNLSHSQISKIEDDAFVKQSQLITLELSNNLLAEIDSVKMDLASLQTLNLVGNKLTKLGMVNSINLPNLKSLKIAENPFDSTYLYDTMNEWVKNGLRIDVELIAPTSLTPTTTAIATTNINLTSTTVSPVQTTEKPKPKPTTPIKTITIGTKDAVSSSTSSEPTTPTAIATTNIDLTSTTVSPVQTTEKPKPKPKSKPTTPIKTITIGTTDTDSSSTSSKPTTPTAITTTNADSTSTSITVSPIKSKDEPWSYLEANAERFNYDKLAPLVSPDARASSVPVNVIEKDHFSFLTKRPGGTSIATNGLHVASDALKSSKRIPLS